MNCNRSILVVEDDQNDVFFLSEAFRRSQVNIPYDVVTDGHSAIEFLVQAGGSPRAFTPSIVLLDLNLPRKSGMEVLRWIRNESPCKTIVVIILTASTSEGDMREAYQSGANSYIIKPSDPTRLSDLSRHLKEYWCGWNQIPSLVN